MIFLLKPTEVLSDSSPSQRTLQARLLALLQQVTLLSLVIFSVLASSTWISAYGVMVNAQHPFKVLVLLKISCTIKGMALCWKGSGVLHIYKCHQRCLFLFLLWTSHLVYTPVYAHMLYLWVMGTYAEL